MVFSTPWDWFGNAPIDHFSFFVERAVMAPDVPKIDADRHLNLGPPDGYFCNELMHCFFHGNSLSEDLLIPFISTNRLVNLRLARLRQLAYEAADCGLLSPDMAAPIRRVKVASVSACEWATGCLPSKEDSFSASLPEWIFVHNGIGRH
jgi:hypothetical protein